MRLIVLHFILILCSSKAHLQTTIGELTNDGAWCWFSDPRAILTDDNKIITGWVKKDGTVEAAQFNPNDLGIITTILYEKMEVDDHNNPAFLQLPDGHLLSMYTWHGSKDGIVWHKTTTARDITSFSQAVVIKPGIETLLPEYPKETYTYANPYYLSAEKKIYAFGRWIGYKPNMIQSTNGEKWENEKVIISRTPFESNNRPYVKYASDGVSKIHLVFTDGHPAVEPLNAVYHCYYEKGAFWRSDGSKICSIDDLPFRPEDATLIYQPDSMSGRAWLADIAIDAKGSPVVTYTRHPQSTDHRYHYAWFNTRKGWIDREICSAGQWFPQTIPGTIERELYYHGNLTIHPGKPNTIYLSRQINDRFEIEKRVTSNKGKSWKIIPVTQNSTYDQVRPYVPRQTSKKSKTVVLWMENKKYVHYTDYDTKIRFWIDP